MFFDGADFREDRIELSVTGPAFRFGMSFFETLFWDGAGVCRLAQHLARVHASLAAFDVPYVNVDFEDIIQQVAEANGLIGKCGRVNIIYPVDSYPDADIPACRPVICAVKYDVPEVTSARRLTISPRPLYIWMGAHKSANYLPYFMARREAATHGFDDALLVSPDGYVLEAATSALVFRRGKTFVTPRHPLRGESAPGVLPSTALEAARGVLAIEEKPILLQDVDTSFDSAYVLNSLIGMLPVASIGDALFEADGTPCGSVRKAVHSR